MGTLGTSDQPKTGQPRRGYGWGLEPDLRSVTSQPGAALHAFEAIAKAGAATSPQAVQLCDCRASVTLMNDTDASQTTALAELVLGNELRP